MEKKQPFKTITYGLNKLTGKQKIKLSEKGEDIILGPFEGAMDNLRISDIVRYKEDFQAEKKSFTIDSNTRALFLFDGNFKGSSALTKETIEAK